MCRGWKPIARMTAYSVVRSRVAIAIVLARISIRIDQHDVRDRPRIAVKQRADAIERNSSWNCFSLSVRVSAGELANALSIACPTAVDSRAVVDLGQDEPDLVLASAR